MKRGETFRYVYGRGLTRTLHERSVKCTLRGPGRAVDEGTPLPSAVRTTLRGRCGGVCARRPTAAVNGPTKVVLKWRAAKPVPDERRRGGSLRDATERAQTLETQSWRRRLAAERGSVIRTGLRRVA